MPEEAISVIYLTTSSAGEAQAITTALLEKKLVACANILAPATSLYRWEGKINSAEEYPVILKTTAANVKQAEEAIAEMHSYECPCIVSFKVEDGYPAFLEWIRDSVR